MHSLLLLRKFDLFRKIVDILSLVKRNILISPLEGEKKFLSELCELRNFREGYKKYKTLDRATECAMICVGEKKGKTKMNKNNLQQKQTSCPAAFSAMNYSPLTTHHLPKRKTAFTLAEVLITLGIIGVVAAMTMPALIHSYQKQVTVNKLKKAYSILGQVALQGVSENPPAEIMSGNKVNAVTTKEFLDNYWLKYFKGAKVYNKKIPLNDGTPYYRSYNGVLIPGNIYTDYNFGRIFFATADNMTFYMSIMSWANKKFDDKGNVISQDAIYSSRQSVHVDVNGINPPNTFGKDVFCL